MGYDVVGLANNGHELINCANSIPFDYVLSDTVMPIIDGFSACHEIKSLHTKCKFIITTAYQDLSFPIRMATNKVDAVLIKDFPKPKLNTVIEVIGNNKRYIDPLLYNDVVKSLPLLKDELSELSELSEKAIQIDHKGQTIKIKEKHIILISAIYQSYSATDIANLLHISPAAVNQSIKRLKSKLDIKNRMELIKLFLDLGLIRNISQQQNENEE